MREYEGKTETFYAPNGEKKQTAYKTREDFLGNIAKVSEERANRPMGIVEGSCDIQPVNVCSFCNYGSSTPTPRIEHACGAVSIPNLYPWERYDWITIYPPFGQHKLLLSDMWFEDLERMMESSWELAEKCSRDPEVIGFMDFTNWGAFAGASQQHPHSQRRSITHLLDPVQEREFHNCKKLAERYGENPFTMLLKVELDDGRRVVHNNDVFIEAAYAPTCSNELLVFPQEGEFSHVLQMSYEDRRRIIRPILGIFPALFFYCGVTDLNIAIHQAPLKLREEARKYFRWHMHIYPRRPKLPADRAGAEIGFETDVIDVLPEIVGPRLRQWYREGPNPELLVKLPDGSTNPSFQEAFNRTFNNK